MSRAPYSAHSLMLFGNVWKMDFMSDEEEEELIFFLLHHLQVLLEALVDNNFSTLACLILPQTQFKSIIPLIFFAQILCIFGTMKWMRNSLIPWITDSLILWTTDSLINYIHGNGWGIPSSTFLVWFEEENLWRNSSSLVLLVDALYHINLSKERRKK